MLRELEAELDPASIRTLEMALDTVINRIYAGIEVDKAGLERVREAAKRGTLVLLPSHKSHVDYLILSFVFNHANLLLPLIAAGDNLSFFPLGPIFRRGGAFFIRRCFRGDRLYARRRRRVHAPAHPRRFLHRVLPRGRALAHRQAPAAQGRALQHGGRRRAQRHGPRELFFVPVSIGYERIVEGSAIVRELPAARSRRRTRAASCEPPRCCAEATAASTSSSARSSRSMRHAWARASADVLRNAPPSGADLSPAKRRAMVTRLAHRVMTEINRVTAVTPGSLVATALLTTQRAASRTASSRHCGAPPQGSEGPRRAHFASRS